jgi:hypothetical protein
MVVPVVGPISVSPATPVVVVEVVASGSPVLVGCTVVLVIGPVEAAPLLLLPPALAPALSSPQPPSHTIAQARPSALPPLK